MELLEPNFMLQSSYNEVLQCIMDKEVAVWSMMTQFYHLTFRTVRLLVVV
jgi:hypothetical protein